MPDFVGVVQSITSVSFLVGYGLQNRDSVVNCLVMRILDWGRPKPYTRIRHPANWGCFVFGSQVVSMLFPISHDLSVLYSITDRPITGAKARSETMYLALM